jgi:UDP-2,3-diacylglucosamine pyrophosphatase LpxH
MKTVTYDVVILSDLHLGSEMARASEALDLLRSLRFHRLILLGDIFCDLNFRRLNQEHWRFLSYIRTLSESAPNVEVVWVEGNHDCGLTQVMSHLVGVPVYQEYMWESAGERNLAIHGHQFDSFVVNNHVLMSRFANSLYLSIQKFSSNGEFVARILDELNTQWQRLTPKVANGALAYARARGARRVFCGHTHRTTTVADSGVVYYNTGAWINGRPSYITILGKEVAINEYIGRIDNCHTGEERGEIIASPSDVVDETRLSADAEYESVYS